MEIMGLPQRFPLTKQNSQESIQAIHSVTNGKINFQYVAVIIESIHKRKHTWSSFLDVQLHDDVIKQIIGKDGLHFKHFTTKYGLDLIWHDRETKRFLLWGPKTGVISALYALKRQMKRFLVKHEQHIAAVIQLDQTMNMVRLRTDDDYESDTYTEQPRQKKIKRE